MEALEAARAGETLKANQLGGTLQDFYTNKQPLASNKSLQVIDDDINFNDGSTDGIMGIDVEYPGNELFANASAPGNNFSYNTGNPYKDNLYNEDGEYDPYSIKGEPEVKEIATG